MLTLFHGSGSGSCEILHEELSADELLDLMFNVRRILRARGYDQAVDILQRVPFEVYTGTNDFNDDFSLLFAAVPLERYEELRRGVSSSREAFRQIAEVITEIGPYIRFIKVEMERASPAEWDVFLCHAGEDKESIAVPLFSHLDKRGIRCWIDQGEVLWGDSITQKVNEGISRSRFVIVALTANSVNKRWPMRELNSAFSMEIESGKTRVLPLLAGTSEELASIRGALALQHDKRYLVWRGDPEEISEALQALFARERSVGQ
jgi:hypothetical protein